MIQHISRCDQNNIKIISTYAIQMQYKCNTIYIQYQYNEYTMQYICSFLYARDASELHPGNAILRCPRRYKALTNFSLVPLNSSLEDIARTGQRTGQRQLAGTGQRLWSSWLALSLCNAIVVVLWCHCDALMKPMWNHIETWIDNILSLQSKIIYISFISYLNQNYIIQYQYQKIKIINSI